MTVELAYPHLAKRNGGTVLERLPRVRVSQVVRSYHLCGSSVDQTCAQYTHLTPAEVHSAMAYYHDHRDEIDAEIEKEDRDTEEWLRNYQPSPLELRLRADGRTS
jgi:uncharacterized protein (DUF433 family)